MRKILVAQKFILVILLCAAGVSASAWAFARLSYGTLNARSRIVRIEADTKQFEEDQASSRALAKMMRDRATDIGRVRAFFANKREPVEFIEKLEELGRATRVSAALSLAGSGEETGTLSFRLALEGAPRDLETYLKLFGLVPYDVAIRDLAFQKLEEGARNASGAAAGSHRLTLLVSVTTISEFDE